MKPHEHLFLSRHIAMGRGGIEKVIKYLQDYLPATFTHPLKTMEDCNMFSFLPWSSPSLFGVLEFKWSLSRIYTRLFVQPSRCVQDECAHMVTEIVSLLNHIRSCQYLQNINTVEKMENLQKLNTDLFQILEQYFSTNIWMPDVLEN